MTIFEKLQSLDRRVVYLLLFLSVGLALVPKTDLPVIPSNQAQSAYDAIEKAAKESPDKIAIIGADWSASTKPENGAQTIAILHHLMKRKIKFAILGFDQQGPELVSGIMLKPPDKLAAKYGYKYGKDWINWGFRPSSAQTATLKAMVRNIPAAIKKDDNETPLTDTAQLPIMEGIQDMNQVSLLVEVAPSNAFEPWVAFVQGYKGTPLIFCPTAVMAPEAYQYLDSGQMVGMLTGLKGAIEYEGLVKEPDRATRQALALSASHVLIIVLIILGNLGYLVQRRRQQREQGA